ncbi:MAG: hypothetical protein E6J90_42490 [Deltaproteobacteria bacterium]|nr:MAG: hypothetical protein E6J90_42490 [Deltaproteobacteria bacterium]TMQ09904.1 MAG: hypothetical protein E6J91_28720 [Deltaproteobacteria bacterium]
MTARLAALVVLAGPLARAEPRPPAPAPAEPDPAADHAGEANLESTSPRRGVTFTVSVGGGMILGLGVDNSTGRGGALSLRLGHVATPSTVIAFEIMGTGALHRPAKDPQGNDAPIETNTVTHLLAGAQHWINSSLWVRAAAGLGLYQGRGVRTMQDPVTNKTVYLDDTRLGPAVLGGVGFEVLRVRSAAFGFETAMAAAINREGVVASTFLNLGVSFD